MGTDCPFPWPKTAVGHILATPGLSDGERVTMLEETAEKLLAVRARSGEGRLRVEEYIDQEQIPTGALLLFRSRRSRRAVSHWSRFPARSIG